MPQPTLPPDQLPQHIVSLLRSGDRTGLALLHEHYSAALYRILLERLGRKEIAQEALQDVLLKAWTNIRQYEEKKGRFFTWLARIARNTAIDITRSKRFKQAGKTQALPDFVFNDRALSESSKTSDPGLRNVLQSLTEDEQRIIHLLYFKGYTHKEASEALNMPLGTVKTYQLWALIDGNPVDMGIFALTAEGVIEVPFITGAQTFAITLEDAGGNPTPNLDQLYVIGSV